MKHAHVRFGKEPAGKNQIVRAVERERKRTQHQVRYEVYLPSDSPSAVAIDGIIGLEEKAPGLVTLWKYEPRLAHVGELPSLDCDDVESGAPVLREWKASDILPRHSQRKETYY